MFCVAVELGEHSLAETAQGGGDVLQATRANLNPFLTVLRFGGGQSNAGCIDIDARADFYCSFVEEIG